MKPLEETKYQRVRFKYFILRNKPEFKLLIIWYKYKTKLIG